MKVTQTNPKAYGNGPRSSRLRSIGNEAEQTLLHPTILQLFAKHFIALVEATKVMFQSQ